MTVYVPYRASAARHHRYRPRIGIVPYRGPGLGFLGDSNLLRSAGAGYTGATIGTAAGSIILGGGTTVASAVGASAAMGSFVPVIGTAIGLVIGLVASGVFNHRVDPEVGNFNNAIAAYQQGGPNAILNIADKYLVLAGLFDLEPGQIKGNIPIYKKYGRMGEERFVNDMVRVVYNAAQSGQIGPNDTVDTVWNRIVLPWINSFGYGTMTDNNADMINTILLGLIVEYVTGLYAKRWFARGGTLPASFQSIPPFQLPASAQTAATPPPVTPVASVPTAALPTNSTPGPPPPQPGTQAWMLSAGYAIIGTDPQYGAIYKAAGAPVVLVNGQIVAYPQPVPSMANQTPSVAINAGGVSTLPALPIMQPLPASPFGQQPLPPFQYSGAGATGGGGSYTAPDLGAPVAPVQSAGLVSSGNPWVIAAAVGVGVMLLMGFKKHETGAKPVRK